jgi:hypothetical protein
MTWALGDKAIHSGSHSDTATANTTVVSGTDYTVEFVVSGVGTGGYIYIMLGTAVGATITANGHYIQNITANGTSVNIFGYGTITVDYLILGKNAIISAITDEYELYAEWDNKLALFAAYMGLDKDKKQAAELLKAIYSSDFDYLYRNLVEVIPDGRDAMTYK